MEWKEVWERIDEIERKIEEAEDDIKKTKEYRRKIEKEYRKKIEKEYEEMEGLSQIDRLYLTLAEIEYEMPYVEDGKLIVSEIEGYTDINQIEEMLEWLEKEVKQEIEFDEYQDEVDALERIKGFKFDIEGVIKEVEENGCN